MTKPERFKSLRDLARITGRNMSTVRYWIDQGKLVMPPEGMTAAEIIEWVAVNIQPVGKPRTKAPHVDPNSPDDPNNPDYHLAKAKNEYHKAELARLKVEQMRGNLIEASEVEREWSAKIAALSDAVEKEIAKTAPKLPKLAPAEILKELRSMWRRSRERATIQDASE